jgi:putative ABC transport system substrate-binding protein
MNSRRLFLWRSGALPGALCIGLSSVGLYGFAADSRLRRIGLLSPVFPISNIRWQAFLNGMRELGYIDGRNVVFMWRSAEGKYDRLASLAEELVKDGAEVIVTHTNAGAVAARKATTSIPIVSAAFADPVLIGLAASLARPGGNVTGISIVTDETAIKLIEFARNIVPKLARAAVLGEPDAPGHQRQMQMMEEALRRSGVKALPIWARTAEDIAAGFDTMARERVQAVFVLLGSFMVSRRVQIAQLAMRKKIATYTNSGEFPETGSLLGYGTDLPALFQRAATYVDKILKGAKPSDLPVEQPMRFETVVNMKTAKELGLVLPQELLLRADRVIE